MCGLQTDREDPTVCLVAQFGHCSQELLNLFLCGVATPHVFDGWVMAAPCNSLQLPATPCNSQPCCHCYPANVASVIPLTLLVCAGGVFLPASATSVAWK